jgi:hypothetical protein
MNASQRVGGPLHSKAPLTRSGFGGRRFGLLHLSRERNSDGWKERNADH